MRSASTATRTFREVLLRKPKVASAWDSTRGFFGVQAGQYSAGFSIIVPGFGIGVAMLFLLPDAWAGLALLGGFVGAVLGFWYFQIHEPALNEKILRSQALALAKTPVRDLEFSSGEHGHFLPKGVLQTASRDIFLGIDPENLLIRHVEIDSARRLSTDRIYGIEKYTDVALVRIPVNTAGIVVGRLFGHKKLTCPAVRFSQGDRAAIDLKIDPEQVDDARELVHQINLRRSAKEAIAT